MSKNNSLKVKNSVINRLFEEAKKNKIKVDQIDPLFRSFKLSYQGQNHYILNKKIGLNPTTSAIVSNKYLTNKILNQHKIKVPRSFLVNDFKEVNKLISQHKIKFPFVIKPFDYSLGVAVTANITNLAGVKMAIKQVKKYWQKNSCSKATKKKELLMVEEYVKGNDYRILVINSKVIAVTHRDYPEIIGNGKKSVKQLIIDYYKNHAYFTKKRRKPLIDQELKRNLKMQKVSMTDILKKAKLIRLRQTANVFSGGISINRTDTINPFYKKIASQACQVFNLKIAGIDLITNDISKPGNYKLIEINSLPSIDMHENPDIGQPINVSKEILKAIFPNLK